MKIKKIKYYVIAIAALILTPLLSISVYSPNAAAFREITFPIVGGARFSDDFNAARSEGAHNATDIFANKMQQIVSPVHGTVVYVAYPQPSWGYMIGVRDSEGYRYNFIHINNDMPGTDDGAGGGTTAYAPDIKQGNPVVKGQLLGYVGDSGNAETTAPHLHFEIIQPDGTPENPYDSLLQAERLGEARPYPALSGELLPYREGYGGGVNMAMGNFDLDSSSELVTAPTNGGPHIKVFDNPNNSVIAEFFAYDPAFTGGVDVAVGDVNGDNINEIITAAGPGGGPHVKAFSLGGQLLASFYAYDPAFTGGVRVTSGDTNGDGTDEIIVAPSTGGGPHVKVLNLNGQELNGFYAYDPAVNTGIDIAAGDVTGTGNAEIVTGPGAGGGPHVRIFNPAGQEVRGFYVYDPAFKGGVKVSVGNVNMSSAKSEILTSPTGPGGPHIRLFDGSANALDGVLYLERWWDGYYDVAAGDDASRVSTGQNRRGSIRVPFQ